MTAALILLVGVTLLIALALMAFARALEVEGTPETDALDALLPQTQCGQCKFDGCRPYADAIARGEADIDRCPPGGQEVIREIALLLGRDVIPLNPEYGHETAREIAFVDEQLCIGCKKCIQACPVDAIVGAPKLMHTVIADECTGCKLCVPVCPVDCITMLPAVTGIRAWKISRPKREPRARID
ncbi:MAG: electron transport complex subunit RsxB [Gammaproteobacteria bacterium]|nr:electron transport complex subunit RsxB [Gammaproteobacteria bacterium]